MSRCAMTDIEDRFWDKVSIGDGCWEWTGCKDALGYSKLTLDGRYGLRGHRISWEFANGQIPDGMVICHRCDNRACVRPGHLFLGTKADNSADMVSKGRSKAGEFSPGSKLTHAIVREIRDAVASGSSQREMARKYSVDRSTVSLIVNRKTWR